MSANIFSDNWFIVSKLNVSLLNSILVHKHYFKNTVWYLLEEVHNNKHYRIDEATYYFIKSLDSHINLEENWQKYIKNNPMNSPTQDEVIAILIQMHSNNLLYFKNRAQNEYVFDKIQEKKKKELFQKINSFLFIKIPIFNPNKLLNTIQFLSKYIFSKYSFALWLLVIFFAFNSVFSNIDKVFSQSQGMLAPSNLFLLYISIFILKLFHELAHGIAIKKYNGHIYTFGFMFILFTPLPYVDASNSWVFKNKWHRILVSSAGMYIELFIAGIFALVWANTGEGTLNSLAFNIMVSGSVTSILFNANPLLKFDSYFILSDYLEIPNLYQRSHAYSLSVLKKFFFNIDTDIQKQTIRESIQLIIYGILSYIYKLFLTIAIVFFVADQWFEIGVIIFLISFYTLILKPINTFLKFILFNEQLYKNRKKVILISSIIFISFIIFITLQPIDDSIKANGVVNLKSKEKIYIKADGILIKIHVKSTQFVNKGDLLFEFTNKTLDFELEESRAMLIATKNELHKAINGVISQVKPIKERIEFLNKKINYLKKQRKDLKITASRNGVIILEKNIDKYLNSYVKNYMKLAEIFHGKNYEFIGVVTQDMAEKLFNKKDLHTEVKLYADTKKTIRLENSAVIPHEKNELPSAVLGWSGGGLIEVLNSDKDGLKTKESFFEIRGELENKTNLNYFQSQYGIAKISLGKTTIFDLVRMKIYQLAQKKYRL
ncbi:MAG: hypothetical protein CL624_07350 [Arcobacter sp.]|nr:hypothetical protein [Arcobacter sp.]|tara:strand:- start:2413 stop:4563 length:2151 start_codon:yes stop_codon:yes gene_type:complete